MGGVSPRALALPLVEPADQDMAYVEHVTTADNLAPCRVIETNGATLAEQFLAAVPWQDEIFKSPRYRIARRVPMG